MSTIKEFRGGTPPMTERAEIAARQRLLAAARGEVPEPVRPRRRSHGVRLGLRLAIAGALAVAIGAGAMLARDQSGMSPVASVRDLGERAAQAAYDDKGMTPNPGQWLYIKELQAPSNEKFGVEPSKRTTWEQWTSVDGEQVAWYHTGGKLLIQGNHPGLGDNDLAEPPVTPEGVLGRIRAVLEKEKLSSDDPLPSLDERLFQAVYQLMGTQALSPEVRAALFRALPTIPGVTYTQEVQDADGRKGVAFSYTGDWTRYDLILDPVDFRFLGTYGVTVKDHTMEYTNEPPLFVKAGTPLTLTARLEAKVVDRPGQR
ncbi:CU044_5270 family protein [Spongiactinospora sp. 9N601]|uniref:CU044_5270 family protein n=1 Tax=Spongiactinospora sp. 9N601 TaxID=3375149 RepID=UPI0037AA17E4